MAIRVRSLFLLYSILALIWTKPLSADDCLTLSFLGAGFTSDADKKRFEDIFIGEGLCINVIRLPNERAKAALLAGDIDGEVGRSENYLALVSASAIRVPAELMRVDLFLATKDPTINAAADLKSGEIAYIRGFKSHEDALNNLGLTGIAVDSFDALYKLLNAGRVKAVPIDSLALEAMKDQLAGFKTFPLGSFATYVYVHKKHADLVPQIAKAINTHLASGNDFIPDIMNTKGGTP